MKGMGENVRKKVLYDYVINTKVTGPLSKNSLIWTKNIVGDYGISDTDSPNAVHDNQKYGYSMWIKEEAPEDFELVFDFEGSYPIGKMYIWNYNRYDSDEPQKDYIACGLREIKLFTSVNQYNWEELKGKGYPYILQKATGEKDMAATNLLSGEPVDFGGITARYVKLRIIASPGIGNWDKDNKFNNSFGISKIRFFTGEGYAVLKDDEWTELFARRDGWAGGDGIYSIPLDGKDNIPNHVHTMFTFGDTLIGNAENYCGRRSEDTFMINNSICVLKNGEPKIDNISFHWQKDAMGNNQSALIPDRNIFSDYSKDTFFWVQDGVVVDNTYYSFPYIVRDEPSNPEGFGFAIEGVAMLSIKTDGEKLYWTDAKQQEFKLFHTYEDNSMLLFGGAVFNNTKEAGALNPDGYIYIYGHRSVFFTKNLYVCRVKRTEIADISSYKFWNGQAWADYIKDAEPIAENVSCELSISYITGKLNNGKLIMIFQEYANSPMISYRIGESPVGPFSEITKLYNCPEPEEGRSIYAYNAKAHPHLSGDDELLISYNVNACNMDMNMAHSEIYSPRFLRLVEVCNDL
ncbi:MAG: DUF4185 domain-containing protein [Anaerolineaceae bacterium]|nr:MAG: DUF4185 domain-containing protein [Anaerolineaceae bacterium]